MGLFERINLLSDFGGFNALQHSVSYGDIDTVIGIIDGIPDINHPSLANSRIKIKSDLISSVSPFATAHATAISSILVGEGNSVLGLCKGCSLLCLPVLDNELLNGKILDDDIDKKIAKAINMAVKEKVSVIQISLEFKQKHLFDFNQTSMAINNATKSGIRTIISSGNSSVIGYNHVLNASGAIPVSMCDDTGRPHFSTAMGITIGSKGFLAPGIDIPVALPPDKYSSSSGSSFSSCFVTATYALLKSFYNTRSPDEIWNAILKSSHDNKHSIIPPLINPKQAVRILNH
jgi:subtilisin family serine protease